MTDEQSRKQKLLNDLDRAFARFQDSYEGLNDEAMERVWLDAWSVKHVLVHMAGWHREMTVALERLGRGERATPEGVDYSDTDGWNQRFTAAVEEVSPAQAKEELYQAYVSFRNAAAALPDDRFQPGRTVERLLDSTGFSHYEEHGEQIRRWREETGPPQ